MTNVHLLRVLVMMTMTISSARPWTLLSNSSRLHCIVVWAEVDFALESVLFGFHSKTQKHWLAQAARKQAWRSNATRRCEAAHTGLASSHQLRARCARMKCWCATSLQGRHAHYPTCSLTRDPQCALFMCCQAGAGADGTAAQSRQQEPQYPGCWQQSAHPCATRAGVSAHASPS